MAELFSVLLRRSVCRNVLFTVFLELTIVYKCTSNQEICMNSNRRNITYSYADLSELTWYEAWQKCNGLGFILPVICDKSEQDALISFLNAPRRSSSVWTSGQKINFANWTWIDGQPFVSRGIIWLPSGNHFHVALSDSVIKYIYYDAKESQQTNAYLCQHSGTSCNSGYARLANGRCIRPSDDHRTWFDARNMCLINGGDLAIINGDDLVKLRESNRLDAGRWYWIGLRKNAWYWGGNKTVPTGDTHEEIKYTNWLNGQPSLDGECISIDASNGGWNAVSCTERKTVVCQEYRPTVETMSSTSAKMPSSTHTVSRMASTRSTLENAANNTTNAESHVLLYSGVGAGIIVLIIICIIVVIIVIRYKRKSNKDMSQTKIKDSSEQNRLDLSPNKPASSPANPSANCPVTETDETRGVYAEISLATLSQPELNSKTEQPGIVYAALDFQREPTPMEPDKKNEYATANSPIYSN